MQLTDKLALQSGYISRQEQLVHQQEIALCQGNGRTLHCHQVALPNRLAATMIWDRCMDISHLSYRGIPLHYAGRNDEQDDISPAFEQRFSGGMLYTCGLLNVGPGDSGQPTHGRIHLQSATMRSTRREGDTLILQGQMRESTLFGENLLLERKLVFPLFKSEVQIWDTITNQTPHPQPYMLLYHINLGYPLLSESLTLRFPEGTQTTPASEYARNHLHQLTTCTPPQADFQEQDYLHSLPGVDGYCRMSAENSDLGIGVGLKYSCDTLPYLNHWRCLRSGDYVLSLEPTNNHVNGRIQAKKDNTLPQLSPFACITTEVTLTFYDLF